MLWLTVCSRMTYKCTLPWQQCGFKQPLTSHIWQTVLPVILKRMQLIWSLALFFLRHHRHTSFKAVYLVSVIISKATLPKKIGFLVQDSSSCILIVACSLLLPAGEGDDRVWWQAKAWLARVVPSPSRFLPSWAYGWRHCYPLALSQQSITFAHKLSKTTLNWKLSNEPIYECFVWVTLMLSTDA